MLQAGINIEDMIREYGNYANDEYDEEDDYHEESTDEQYD